MQTTYDISVSEALEQLKFPSFFDSNERKAAYEVVMHLGNDEEKELAEETKLKYPFKGQEELFSSETEDDNFSIASSSLSA